MSNATIESRPHSLLYLVPGSGHSFGIQRAANLIAASPLPARDPDNRDLVGRTLDLIRTGRLPQPQFAAGTLDFIADLQHWAVSPEPNTDDKYQPQTPSAEAAEFMYGLGRILEHDLKTIVDHPLSYDARIPDQLTRSRFTQIVDTIAGWFADLTESGMLSARSRGEIAALVQSGEATSTAHQIAYMTAGLTDFLSRCENAIPVKSELFGYSRLVRALLRSINDVALVEIQQGHSV